VWLIQFIGCPCLVMMRSGSCGEWVRLHDAGVCTCVLLACVGSRVDFESLVIWILFKRDRVESGLPDGTSQWVLREHSELQPSRRTSVSRWCCRVLIDWPFNLSRLPGRPSYSLVCSFLRRCGVNTGCTALLLQSTTPCTRGCPLLQPSLH
jgi:hypothetical protein